MATYSARALLDKAYDELEVLDVLLAAGTAPWIFGFHAQQIAEKSLKAVLALRGGKAPQRTHDLFRLAQQLSESDEGLPEWSEELDRLNPFAVQLRYETINLAVDWDSREIRDLVVRVYNWAAIAAGSRTYGSSDQDQDVASAEDELEDGEGPKEEPREPIGDDLDTMPF